MNALTSRFQFKIQEALNIQDDQIARLSELLVTYKSKIEELRLESGYLDHQIYSAKQSIKNNMKDADINIGVSKSQKISEHHQEIIFLQEQHNQEILFLQKEFENKISRFHEFSQEQLKDQENGFLDEFEKIRKEIAETRSQIANFVRPEEDLNSSSLKIKNDLIVHLQEIVESKSRERKQILYDSKIQLEECLNIIYELEEKHRKEAEEIREYSEENTRKYKATLLALKQQRNNDIIMLTSQKKKAEEELKQLTKQLNQMKVEFTKSFNDSTMKLKAMKSLTTPVQRPENISPNVEMSKTKKQMAKSLEIRQEKENKLNSVRKENYQLLQQISMMRHSMRYPNCK
ncbi:hypothetical protein TRFO_17827 [Tritrichomonas foetus]|uniref:Uncharacterized protein n=1 Tax=Tritrichomonas foetus TaxID=1144522 RepID=A0A1J4KM12_9EUKA|nr:hypothetical protein TRFO_17827 [Tritrichomonas foetus]|eukprot:OHT12351.1 hypothetical protein TRFO_17827 [Tritrichomonas foetus]